LRPVPEDSLARDTCRRYSYFPFGDFAEKNRSHEKCVQDYRDILYFFASWVLEIIYNQQEIPKSAYMEIVRLFLFKELELTHTCCSLLLKQPKCWDEVCEIQEEEREILLDHERLCFEASVRRTALDGGFHEFLQISLLEVRERPRDIISEDDIQNIKQIGVVFDY